MHHLDPLGQDDMEGTGLSPGGSTVASATLLNSAMAEVLKDFLPVRNPMAQWSDEISGDPMEAPIGHELEDPI